MDRQTYIGMFSGKRQKEALALAHDIRKFEIELYWKRATYFWAFIAIAFAGFFASSNQADLSNSYIIACLGFLFSLAWYFVNRGSSAWQRNWEVHVDLLEDEISGPLHKAIVSRRDYSFWDLIGPYSYSPSRLNTTLSLLLVCVWALLAGKVAWRMVAGGAGLNTLIAFSALTGLAMIVMLFFARSGRTKDVTDVKVTLRHYD